jgi:hypothetical protein
MTEEAVYDNMVHMTHPSLKKTIRHALEANDLDAVAVLAKENRKALSLLVRLAYDKETLVGRRAIKAVGLAARQLIKTDYEYLRETARKLLWSLSDESGGIGWAAPELLGEIVSVDPRRFSDVIPLIAAAYDVEEEVFRPGVVYALGRIAETAPEAAASYQKIVMLSLADKDPLLKIYALELVGRLCSAACTGNLWSREYRDRVRSLVERLMSDRGEAWVYRDGGFLNVQVGERAKEVLRTIL